MKKSILMIFLIIIFSFLFFMQKKTEAVYVFYSLEDMFINNLKNSIIKNNENSKNTFKYIIIDSEKNLKYEKSIIDKFSKQNINAVALNLISPNTSENKIKKFINSNIPIVFFNREPNSKIMNLSNNLYYVGSKGEESGKLNGQILANYWIKHPEADKNKDGIMQYVLLKGQKNHMDTISRCIGSVKALKDNNIKIEEIKSSYCNFNYKDAKDKMISYLKSNPNIEAIISNNDEMALGAIAALKEFGYFKKNKYIPIVGVDKIPEADKAIKDGTLLGTVLNDFETQANAIYSIILALNKKEKITRKTTGYEITDNKYIWIPYRAITKKNYKDFNIF